MEEKKVILSFSRVTVTERGGAASELSDVTFDLHAGDLMLVRVDEEVPSPPLADTAQGIAEPERGTVTFLDRDWSGLGPDAAAALRARTGRVFESGGWLSNLDLDENVVLAESHHTSRPLREIHEEAAKLAVEFGITDLAGTRCHQVSLQDLQRAGWVRAFLGDPLLLILERPERDVNPGLTGPLLESVGAALARGAAVVWLTSSSRIWEEVVFDNSLRFAMSGPELVPVAETVS